MEFDVFGLHLTLNNVNLVATQNDGDVLILQLFSSNIVVPFLRISVTLTVGHIEHDNGSITKDVVAISKTSKLLLASCVPYVESHNAIVGAKIERMHFHTKCGHVLLLKFASFVTFNKYSFTNTPITNKRDFECVIGHLQYSTNIGVAKLEYHFFIFNVTWITTT